MSGEKSNVHAFRGKDAVGGDSNGSRMMGVEARLTRIETVVETTLPHLATKGDVQKIESILPHLATKEDVRKIDLPHLATKEDIQKIKVWCMRGVLGGIGLALAAVVFALLRLFLP